MELAQNDKKIYFNTRIGLETMQIEHNGSFLTSWLPRFCGNKNNNLPLKLEPDRYNLYMLNRKCISYHTLKGNINIEDEISSKFLFVNVFLFKIWMSATNMWMLDIMQTTWYWKNKRGNLIRFEYRYVWTWRKVFIKKYPDKCGPGLGFESASFWNTGMAYYYKWRIRAHKGLSLWLVWTE